LELVKNGIAEPETMGSLAELEEKGDKSKSYVLPDEYIYSWTPTERVIGSAPAYTNRLLAATETAGGTTVYGDGNGYQTGVRLSSSGSVSTQAGMLTTGFISASDGARIRTIGFDTYGATMTPYIISYNSAGTKIAFKKLDTATFGTTEAANKYLTDFTLDGATYGTGIAYIRISASTANDTLPEIVTVNEEIKNDDVVVKEYHWENTGVSYAPKSGKQKTIGFANGVDELDENRDKTSLYVLPNGEVYDRTIDKNAELKNLLPLATEKIGESTIYGDSGYMVGVRLSSNGTATTNNGAGMLATGFISAPDGSVLDGATILTSGFRSSTTMNCYVNTYGSEGALIKSVRWELAETVSKFTLDS
jgi:hypothetical protein